MNTACKTGGARWNSGWARDNKKTTCGGVVSCGSTGGFSWADKCLLGFPQMKLELFHDGP